MPAPATAARPRSSRPLKLVAAAPRRAARATAAEGAGSATDRIAAAITGAIVDRRLMPGTKLGEQQVADLFGVSRTLVRQALNQLSRDHLVTLAPARGAFVAQPSVAEARAVFEVRRMLEASVLRRLAARITPAQVAELRAHLERERTSVAKNDVTGRTRLLADFHVVLARMLGNPVLEALIADLLSRCSLISLMYQSSHAAEHSAAEHVAIVDALERHDTRTALKLMDLHLAHVERDLQLDGRAPGLAAALRPDRR